MPRESSSETQQYIYKLPVITADAEPPKPLNRAQKFRYFKTVHSIKQMRPYRISGRITRVWKVIEVHSFDKTHPVPNAKYVVLKDVWLDKIKKTEAENMKDIFGRVDELLARAKKAGGDDWLARFLQTDPHFAEFDQATKDRLAALLKDGRYKSLFLTTILSWRGQDSKKVSEGAKYSRAGVDIFAQTKKAAEAPKQERTSTMVATNTGNGSEDKQIPQLNRHYAVKQQSRFVYEEVCHKLSCVGTIGNFVDVIDQALCGRIHSY